LTHNHCYPFIWENRKESHESTIEKGIYRNQGVFSGIITKVDSEGRIFSIAGEGNEKRFQWNSETTVIAFPAAGEDTIPEFLKEGLAVKVFYKGAGNTRMAGRIEVKKGDIETLKGWEHPFGCGTSPC
jgi:hypothetical protein